MSGSTFLLRIIEFLVILIILPFDKGPTGTSVSVRLAVSLGGAPSYVLSILCDARFFLLLNVILVVLWLLYRAVAISPGQHCDPDTHTHTHTQRHEVEMVRFNPRCSLFTASKGILPATSL